MKEKFLTIIFASILAIALLASFASAAISISTSTLSKSKNLTTIIISETNTSLGDITVNLSFPNGAYISDGSEDASINPLLHRISLAISSTSVTINGTSPATINVYYTSIPESFEFVLGRTYSTTIFAQEDSNPTNNATATLQFLNTYCERGDIGSNITIRSISDESEETSGDWEWKPLDDISVKVTVKNNGESKKITVKLALYSIEENSFVDLGDGDELEKSIRINKGKSEDFYFDFKLPEDIEEGNYRLYVKAYVSGEEESQCVSKKDGDTKYYKEVSIEYPSEGFSISDLAAPETISCGSINTISFNLYNFDYGDDEKFKVNLYNEELGIDITSTPVEIDEGEKAKFTFRINTSKYTPEKIYNFDIDIYYDYDEGFSQFKKVINRAKTFPIEVKGNCLRNLERNGQLEIKAEQLPEEIKAGRTIPIKITIKNTGTGGTGEEETLYKISVEGIEDFATIKSINPPSVLLKQGESRDVVINLNLNKDAEEGEKTFSIVTSFEGKKISQQASLAITKYTFWDTIKDHWLISLLIVLAVIVVIIIIALAIKNHYS